MKRPQRNSKAPNIRTNPFVVAPSMIGERKDIPPLQSTLAVDPRQSYEYNVVHMLFYSWCKTEDMGRMIRRRQTKKAMFLFVSVGRLKFTTNTNK